VAAEVGDVELHAADVDPAAVACARRTVPPGARVHRGDLDAALPAALRGRVDVLLASPPYVPTAGVATMPPEAREHEPRTALDGGSDGLDVLRRIAVLAPDWLAPGGAVLLECAAHQAGAARDAVAAAGLAATVEHDDEADATVVVGRRP
jgi:release factor glutamine methyltransferase